MDVNDKSLEIIENHARGFTTNGLVDNNGNVWKHKLRWEHLAADAVLDKQK